MNLSALFCKTQVNFFPSRHLSDINELSSGNFGVTYRADLYIGKNGIDDVKFPVVLKVAKGESGSDECRLLLRGFNALGYRSELRLASIKAKARIIYTSVSREVYRPEP